MNGAKGGWPTPDTELLLCLSISWKSLTTLRPHRPTLHMCASVSVNTVCHWLTFAFQWPTGGQNEIRRHWNEPQPNPKCPSLWISSFEMASSRTPSFYGIFLTMTHLKTWFRVSITWKTMCYYWNGDKHIQSPLSPSLSWSHSVLQRLLNHLKEDHVCIRGLYTLFERLSNVLCIFHWYSI